MQWNFFFRPSPHFEHYPTSGELFSTSMCMYWKLIVYHYNQTKNKIYLAHLNTVLWSAIATVDMQLLNKRLKIICKRQFKYQSEKKKINWTQTNANLWIAERVINAWTFDGFRLEWIDFWNFVEQIVAHTFSTWT